MTTYTGNYELGTILSYSSKVDDAAKVAAGNGADIIVVTSRNAYCHVAPVVNTGRNIDMGSILDKMRRKGWLAVGSFMCGQRLALEHARIVKFVDYMQTQGFSVHQVDGDRSSYSV